MTSRSKEVPRPPTTLAPPAPVRDDAAEREREEALRVLVEAGDAQRALPLLMRTHGDAVYTRAYRIVENRQAAKDVLQQTFLTAHRDLSRFEGRSSVRSWLLGIATHRALDVVRRVRREQRRAVSDDVLATLAADDADPQGFDDAPRRTRALEDCLRELSAEIRATVLMRFQQEMSFEEMGRTLGEKPGTLHARVARALPALRRCLERKGVAP